MTRKKYYFDGCEPLPDGLRDNVALMLEYSKDDATTFVFEEVGKTKGGEKAKNG